MLPTSNQYEAPEVQIQNTRLRGLTTPDLGNQGMENGLTDRPTKVGIKAPSPELKQPFQNGFLYDCINV